MMKLETILKYARNDLNQLAIKYNTHYQLYEQNLAILPWVAEEEKDLCIADCQAAFPGMQVFYNTQDFEKVVITGDIYSCVAQKYSPDQPVTETDQSNQEQMG